MAWVPLSRRDRGKMIRVGLTVFPLAVTVLLSAQTRNRPSTARGDWPTYGGDLASSKYSTLDQINKDNFSKLRVAWRAKSPDGAQRSMLVRERSSGFITPRATNPAPPVPIANFDVSEMNRVAHLPTADPMLLILPLLAALRSVFRSRAAAELEILALRHQFRVQHAANKRPRLTPADRLLWIFLSQFWSDWSAAVAIVKPETVIG